jgi:biopolymer transport protein ExbB
MLKLILTTGGWVLIPLGVLSVVALAVTIERCWRLLPLRKHCRVERQDLLEILLREGPDGASAALGQATPVARIARAGLAARSRGPDLVRLAALDAAQREVAACERGLGILLAATQVAPLFGLLGTVLGLVEAFQAASAADQVSTRLLAGGIYKALGATIAGLLIAIPAFLAYAGLNGVVARIADQFEQAATDLPLALK